MTKNLAIGMLNGDGHGIVLKPGRWLGSTG